MLDIKKILFHQRNRYPYLFIDRVTQLEAGHRAIVSKAFTYNEMFFPGHFDDEPNVPGFIQLECLVQAFLMTFQSMDEYSGMTASDSEFKNVTFKRKVIPGDVLVIDAHLHSIKRGVAIGAATSTVNCETACSAEFVVAIPEILDRFKPKT
jgi:3-hydroxyacyl-[acyl-carrier-protein] dehydratase